MADIDQRSLNQRSAESPTVPVAEETLTPQREAPPVPPALSPVELLRWAWRQLTSMRTALVLLFLLALAAVPGSLLPQRGVNPADVARYLRENPTVGPLFDRLSLFDVYASPWFAATYLLLFTSLAGCVLPRSRQHWKAMRARPPAAPRNLARLPQHADWRTASTPTVAADAATAALRARRFRVDVQPGAGPAVCAEKGYLRETGNLVFHAALLVLLVALALGALFGFRGDRLVVEGDGFANLPTQYDDIEPGRLFDAAAMAPFSFTLQDFSARFEEEGPQRGAAREFAAEVDVVAAPGADARRETVHVNHPLVAGDTKVFLVGHGYAPRVTVRNGEGTVVFQGAVPFLPRDGNFTSTGVIKVTDTLADEQLGFTGFFLPTAIVDDELGPISDFPAPRDPALFFTAFVGDLGVDDGQAASVFRLDTSRMQQLQNPDQPGQPLAAALRPGETQQLPDSLGSITFDGYAEWARFQVADDPGRGLALASAVAAIAGLLLSLRIRRRRVWVRTSMADDGRTVVAVGGLSRSDSTGFADEFARLVDDVRLATGEDGPVPSSAELGSPESSITESSSTESSSTESSSTESSSTESSSRSGGRR